MLRVANLLSLGCLIVLGSSWGSEAPKRVRRSGLVRWLGLSVSGMLASMAGPRDPRLLLTLR